MKLNNKAFTLIELIVVIAILAVLVLFAAPKFLGHTKDAKLAQIKNDIRVHEIAIEEQRVKANIKGEDYFENLPKINAYKLEEFRDKNSLYDRKGLVSESEEFIDEYFEYPEGLVNTKLKGDFFVSQDGKVYYHEEGLGDSELPQTEGPSDVDLGMEDDFEWVPYELDGAYVGLNGDIGFFRYIGRDKGIVEIPHIIQGVPMASYYMMFYETGEDVEKVISTNDKVTDMSNMFRNSQATTLDLSSFDTSSVTNMSNMFRNSQATTLDLSSFDTSSVTTMSWMFADSQATTLDLSSFNTSKVANMYAMFANSQATSLDLSNWDTSSVTYMDGMFSGSQATTLDLSSFDTSSVTNMGSMFANSQATSLDLSNWDTSNVTDMYGMFEGSQAITLDLSSFDTANVAHMDSMFYNSQATTGYARTEDDADRFNSDSTDRPSGLTFIVHPDLR